MGWLHKLFGEGKDGETGSRGSPATSQFHESETTAHEDAASRNAPRRELVQVILRDTMRKHGIPSDWIECRILSTVSRSGRPGMHVTFVVRQAHDRLLGYVFAFQDSFQGELARFEPRSKDWMLSLSWEFQGQNLGAGVSPPPRSWGPSTPAPLLGVPPTQPRPPAEDPLDRAFAPTGDPAAEEGPRTEDDVQRDLDALFAIRDAAIAQTAGKPSPDQPGDFQNTQPFRESEKPKR